MESRQKRTEKLVYRNSCPEHVRDFGDRVPVLFRQKENETF